MSSNFVELLKELELRGALKAWNALNENPQSIQDLSVEEVMETLLLTEKNDRDQRRQESLLKISRIPVKVPLSNISYSIERGNDFKKIMNSLVTLDFIKRGYNLCIFGGSGSGKSFIACALGTAACLKGYTTRFYSTNDLLNQLTLAKGSSVYQTKRVGLKRASLLIIDDFCLSSDYSVSEQDMLFEVLNDRYQYKSVTITSQKTPNQWIKDMGVITLAVAIVERLANNNFTFAIEGKSMRKSLEFPTVDL